MDWIFDNFQIFVLIAVVIGSLVKRFLEAKAAEKQARDEMPDDDDVFEPDEWMSPQPQPSVPPPLVPQRTPPPLRVEQNDVEALLKRQQDMQERLKQIKEAKSAAGSAAGQRKAKPVKAVKTSLRGSLRDRREIRRAIVMREILGPPVGLR